jgi:hypothetical protein
MAAAWFSIRQMLGPYWIRYSQTGLVFQRSQSITFLKWTRTLSPTL